MNNIEKMQFTYNQYGKYFEASQELLSNDSVSVKLKLSFLQLVYGIQVTFNFVDEEKSYQESRAILAEQINQLMMEEPKTLTSFDTSLERGKALS